MMGYWGYYGVVGTIFWIFFWIIVIALIIRLVRGPRWHGHYHGDRHDALTILKERYAKGEINKAEYEEKKADLSNM